MKYRDQGKVYLGKTKNGDACYLTQHKWDCGWYHDKTWAFGYIGNSRWHAHISSMIDHPDKYDPNWHNVAAHFESTWLTQKQWWIIRDLFIQAYALKKAAETYKYGGSQTEAAKDYRVTSGVMASLINDDLEKLLGRIWDFICEARAMHTKAPEILEKLEG